MKLIPPYIHNSISNAERKIFNIIKETEGLDEWYCLHSLGLNKHLFKREGEIDILLIGPQGIFVLEVKGGRVKREQGLWKFTDRYGRVSQKRESPFVQARSAMYSLRADLAQYFTNSINQNLFGYGVVFPDITFTTESPEWDLNTVYDSRDLQNSFGDYLERLINSWKSHQRSAKPLSKKEIVEIVRYVRGDFEAVCPVSVEIADTEESIIKLTEEQLYSLDAMADNKRIIFQGAAGTGKTLLAVEQAKRNNSAGIRTLFLCYNKFLASYLKATLKTSSSLEHVEVKTIHGFFRDIIIKAGYDAQLQQAEKASPNQRFQSVYPELFMKAWQESDTYDYLIIDEAQDVLSDIYIDCLNKVIKGGFSNGLWSIYIDPENQGDIFLKLQQTVLDTLRRNSVTYNLSVNCRNTKPIAIQTEIISGIQTAKVKKVEGIPVKYIWFADDADQALQVSDVVNRLLKDGVKSQDITLLSPKRYSSSLAGTGRLRVSKPLFYLSADNIVDERGDRIAYTSIQSFKGLEGSVIVLTDISDLDDAWDKIVNYVGFTRARTALVVAIRAELKSTYTKKLKELRKDSRNNEDGK